MKLNKIDTVLFDLDGTLLDTAPDLATALNVVLKRHNRPQIPFTKIRPLSSTGSKGLLNLGFQIDETHAEYKSLREQFLQAYHEHIDDATTMFPGMDSVLKHLEIQNLPWGIVTNKPTDLALQLLEKFNLTQRAACIVGGDMLAKRKPDPDPLLYACEILGCDARQCVYIGDAERDIAAAKHANMHAVAALYGYIADHEKPETWDADFYIDKPEQIIDWLQNK